MRALQLIGFGEPADVAGLVDRPQPEPGDGQVLVKLHAASINPSDLRLMRGLYGVRPQVPAPLGVEGSGQVIEAGTGVDRDLLGRRVMIIPNHTHGTWAESAVIGAGDVVAVSAEADPLQLAMAGVNPVTAMLLLQRYVRLTEGDWIAQTGANSAVGQYVIRLARRAGVGTFNLVRREEAAAQVNSAGGDQVIVVDEDDDADLAGAIERALHGQELALVLDSVGGPVVTELAHRLRHGGKVVSFGAMGGRPTVLSTRDDVIYRGVSHHGFWIVNWLRGAGADEIRDTYEEIAALISTGALAAQVDRTFGLDEYREALTRADAYRRPGKVLFRLGG
jgi:NADPH:quinone reductase-like Zn-dependent oxidoreductase